jgi:hypothetical protein
VEQKPPLLAEVPKIIETTLRDIPGRLRELADAIDSGQHKDIRTCAIVLSFEDEPMRIFGYGDRSEHDTIGLTLLAAANQVARNIT